MRTPVELRRVVNEAWQGGFTVSSETARRYAPHVAMAASLALITTRVNDGEFGRVWRVSSKGLRWLKETE